jgi:hypothetical protein
MRYLLLIALPLMFVACNGGLGSSSRAAPALSEPTADPNAGPPKKNLLETVGDTAARIVQEPVRIFTPKKDAPAQEPETYEAPSAVFTRRGQPDGSDGSP